MRRRLVIAAALIGLMLAVFLGEIKVKAANPGFNTIADVVATAGYQVYVPFVFTNNSIDTVKSIYIVPVQQQKNWGENLIGKTSIPVKGTANAVLTVYGNRYYDVFMRVKLKTGQTAEVTFTNVDLGKVAVDGFDLELQGSALTEYTLIYE